MLQVSSDPGAAEAEQSPEDWTDWSNEAKNEVHDAPQLSREEDREMRKQRKIENLFGEMEPEVKAKRVASPRARPPNRSRGKGARAGERAAQSGRDQGRPTSFEVDITGGDELDDLEDAGWSDNDDEDIDIADLKSAEREAKRKAAEERRRRAEGEKEKRRLLKQGAAPS